LALCQTPQNAKGITTGASIKGAAGGNIQQSVNIIQIDARSQRNRDLLGTIVISLWQYRQQISGIGVGCLRTCRRAD
jgi:hypothetical protein